MWPQAASNKQALTFTLSFADLLPEILARYKQIPGKKKMALVRKDGRGLSTCVRLNNKRQKQMGSSGHTRALHTRTHTHKRPLFLSWLVKAATLPTGVMGRQLDQGKAVIWDSTWALYGWLGSSWKEPARVRIRGGILYAILEEAR